MCKLSGYCYKINWNLDDEELDVLSRRECSGLRQGFDVGHIHSLLASDLYIPSTVLDYLTLKRY